MVTFQKKLCRTLSTVVRVRERRVPSKLARHFSQDEVELPSQVPTTLCGDVQSTEAAIDCSVRVLQKQRMCVGPFDNMAIKHPITARKSWSRPIAFSTPCRGMMPCHVSLISPSLNSVSFVFRLLAVPLSLPVPHCHRYELGGARGNPCRSAAYSTKLPQMWRLLAANLAALIRQRTKSHCQCYHQRGYPYQLQPS